MINQKKKFTKGRSRSIIKENIMGVGAIGYATTKVNDEAPVQEYNLDYTNGEPIYHNYDVDVEHEQECEQDGKQAFESNLSKYHNPYDKGTTEYASWLKGYRSYENKPNYPTLESRINDNGIKKLINEAISEMPIARISKINHVINKFSLDHYSDQLLDTKEHIEQGIVQELTEYLNKNLDLGLTTEDVASLLYQIKVSFTFSMFGSVEISFDKASFVDTLQDVIDDKLANKPKKFLKPALKFETPVTESFDLEHLITKKNETLKDLLDRCIDGDWRMENGLINVKGDVDLTDEGLTKFPCKFGDVIGNFDCFNNKLISLKGCPKNVSGTFECWNNAVKFTEEDVKKLCKVDEKIYC